MVKKINLIKAFTQDKNQGNPAGVVLDADDLSDQQMQLIAAKYNFSECVFIQKSKKADFRTRFFSPQQEVDFCGHATVAGFYAIIKALRNQYKVFTQETNIGIFEVSCYSNGFIEMEQSRPKIHDSYENAQILAKLLTIDEQDIIGPSQIVSTGSPKLIIPIKSLDILFSIKPDFEGIKKYCQESGARGFYPFTLQTIDQASDCHARQFNPLAGINEDPITGIAAGALGVYITHHNILNKKSLIIEQGYSMNKGGKMHVEIGEKIRVGGYALEFGKEEIFI